jgi:putative aldouronate transport system permease protein
MRRDKIHTNPLIHTFFIIWSLICLIPFLICVSASFTDEMALAKYGFTLWPKDFSLDAYAYVFENPEVIGNAYAVTAFITVVGTFLGLIVMTLTAYALARPNFIWKNQVTWILFFPSLFGGGMVASYIVNTQILKMTDNIWIMILPGLSAFFHIVMIRTFFKQLPEGLFDAAKIDGASEWRIYTTIALRLSTPVIATVGFMGAMARWNTWYAAQLYIRTPEKYPLQYLLQRMMMSIDQIIADMEKVPSMVSLQNLPGENLRMAMLVVCIGPMMLVFPFFQNYFTKGMTMGAVKG